MAFQPLSPDAEAARLVLRDSLREAMTGLVGRESLAELVMLGAVAGEHLLVVGPPGTAKSAVVRRCGESLGGRVFEYLLGRFTEPAELFGPVDLRRLREGELAVETTGMLPEADFVFLDELFLGSTAILNTLLGVLNEGRYRRGKTDIETRLRICVAACNEVPETGSLAALADRFLLRAFVEPLPDARLEDLLEATETPARIPRGPLALEALDHLRARARSADLGPARPAYAEAVRLLRAAGIPLSDRRVVRSQRLFAAAATLAGRAEVSPRDLWPLKFVLPNVWAQSRARGLLPNLFHEADPGILAHAAAAASDGPESLAARLLAEVDSLQGIARLHGWLRDVDVAFSPTERPPALEAARLRITQRLQAEPAALAGLSTSPPGERGA
jgi:MoxR-like ATPase